jgi:hypothetical protein
MTSRLLTGTEVSRRSLVKLGAGLGLLAATGQSEAAGSDDMAPDNMTGECSASSSPAMARPCITAHDRNL